MLRSHDRKAYLILSDELKNFFIYVARERKLRY